MPSETFSTRLFRCRKFSLATGNTAPTFCPCFFLDKEDPERCPQRAYLEDYYTGTEATIYEIRGEPDLEEVTRPIDSLN